MLGVGLLQRKGFDMKLSTKSRNDDEALLPPGLQEGGSWLSIIRTEIRKELNCETYALVRSAQVDGHDSRMSDALKKECLRYSPLSLKYGAASSTPESLPKAPRTWCEAVSRACSSGLAKIGTWLRVAKPERRSDEYDNL